MTNVHVKRIATFTDKFGDERAIYQHGGRVKVEKNTDTVVHKMNRAAAVLVGERIKARRLAAGLTLAELCERTGLIAVNPKQRMWAIENATRQQGLRIGTLFALAHSLGCEAADLMPTVAEVAARAGVTVRVRSGLSVA